MIEVVQNVLALIVTLSILVTFHEYGHYWVARLFNVHVLRFSLGFGKLVFTRRGRPPAHVPPPVGQEIGTRSNEALEGTEFAISAIPLGGYVKMLDEREGYVPDDQLHLAFNRKPVLQRIAIVAAGPAANFLLAILAYWLLFIIGISGIAPILGEISPESKAGQAGFKQGQEIVAVDGESIQTWADVNLALFTRIGDTGTVEFQVKEAFGSDLNRRYSIDIVDWLAATENPAPTTDLGLRLDYPEIPAIVGGLQEGEPAAKAGLQIGDEIKALNDKTIEGWADLVSEIQLNPNKMISLSVLRKVNGTEKLISIDVRPKGVEHEGKQVGRLGVSRVSVEFPEEMQRVARYPFYSAWMPAIAKTWSMTKFQLVSIKKLVQGAISPKNLSGPITIAKVAGTTAKYGLESFINFLAMLSIGLGVLNLLPIPVLDGGHLVYYLVELVLRRPVPERIQIWGAQMGMFIIVSIMLLAFYNDLMRL